MNENWLAERDELGRGAADAIGRRDLRAALAILSRLRDRSLRNRDPEGLREVLSLARTAAQHAPDPRAYDLRRLLWATERNLEYLGAEAEPATATAKALEGRIAGAEQQLESLGKELADIRRLAAAAPSAVAPRPASVSRHTAARRAPSAPARRPSAPPAPIRTGPSRVEQFTQAVRAKSGAWILACSGGVVMALGIVLLFALAVNRGWIGPEARVAVGAVVSALVFGTGLWARNRFGATYSALAAVGAGIAGGYATLFAATALYDLVPPPAALVVAAGVAGVGLAASLAFRSELLAGLGLIGAMASPVGVYGGEVTLLGTAFAAFMLAASGFVSVRLRWTRMALVATVVSLPQFTALARDDAAADTWLLALGTAFAAVYLLMAVGHQHVAGSNGLGRLSAWLVLLSAYVAGAGITELYADARREGVALLLVALSYGAVAAALMRAARQRELGVLVAIVALTIGAGAMADLFAGRTLGVVWALEAGVLAWLAQRLRDPRFQLAALAYLALAIGHSVAVEEWQRTLFVVSAHPAGAWPTLVALTAGAGAVGWFVPAFRTEDVPRQGVFGLLVPVFAGQQRLQPALRVLGLATAGFFALVAGSLGILEAAVRAGSTGELGFVRGHLVVDALWAAAGLAAVSIGARRASSSLAATGWLLLGATLVKLVGYDFDHLGHPELPLALVVVGAGLLLAAFAVRRVRLTPVAAILVGALLLVGGATDLVHGYLWGADAEGLALLAVAAAYAALAALCFRSRRGFSTLLWTTSLVLVAVAWPPLVSGGRLVLAWSVCAALVAVLAEVLREKRFLPAAFGFLLLGTVHALTLETPPAELFRAEAHPGEGVAALVAVVAATCVVAIVCMRTAPAEPPATDGPRPFGASLEADQLSFAAMAAVAAAVLAVFAGSLLALELAQAVSSGAVETDFQRGHVGVSAFWGLLGLLLLYVGLVRRSRWLRYAGFAAFALTVGKIFLYDLSNLSPMARALSFLGVGAVLLLGGFFYQRLSAELEDRRRPVNAGA